MKTNEIRILVILAIVLVLAGVIALSITMNRINTVAVMTQQARSDQLQLHLDQTRAANRNP